MLTKDIGATLSPQINLLCSIENHITVVHLHNHTRIR